MAQDTVTINGQVLPAPSKVPFSKVPNIVAELQTMSGKVVADVNGWRYADVQLTWPAMTQDDLAKLITATNAPSFVVKLPSTNGLVTLNAILKGFSRAKVRYKNDGSYVWEDVSIDLSFPDARSF